MKRLFWLPLLVLLLLSVPLQAQSPIDTPFTLLEQKARPADHFTQGLLKDGARWYESSGLFGQSWLAEYTDPGADPVRRVWLASNRFAEGLALYDKKLYLLTYKAGEVQVYRQSDLKQLETLSYAGEGWGLTSHANQLIMSNGSDTLTFRDPQTFTIIRSLPVYGGGIRWSRLNELEYAQGLIWANIWLDDRIIAIDPQSGVVRGWVNLQTLREDSLPGGGQVDAVANGIAWDRARNGLWVTGKLWPKLYLIRPQGLGFDDEESKLE